MTQKQNTLTKTISSLVQSDENIHDLCDFSLNGNVFKMTYKGSTTSSFWLTALKWILPVVILILIALFLYRKKEAVVELWTLFKNWISESINKLIDKINKL